MAKSNTNKSNVQLGIIGDNTDLDESLKDSESIINAFGKRVIQSFNQVASITNDLKDSIVTTFTEGAVALGNFTLGLKENTRAIDSFSGAWEKARLFLEAFGLEVKEVILQNKSLAKTIQLTGKSAGYSAQSLQEYADYLEKTTRYSSEASKGAMQLIMHFRNIHGEQFLAATKAAQDLATELRTDLNSAAQLVGESLNDPIEAMQRLSAVNIFFTKSEEAAIKSAMRMNNVVDAQNLIINKLAKSYGGAAKDAAQGFYGKLDRLRNVLHTIATRVGEAFYNKINQISEALFKGKNVFDVLIEKISHWGQVAIYVTEAVLDKIATFVVSSQSNFSGLFDWLVTKTIKVAVLIPDVFRRAAETLANLNTFIFDSFVKVWNGISNIFITILPASFKYMKDVFASVIASITKNAYYFWLNFKEFAETSLHNIWVEFLKLKTKIGGWFKVIMQAFTFWKKGLLSTEGITSVLEIALTGDKDPEKMFKDILKKVPLKDLPALGALGIQSYFKNQEIEKQVGALDSYKKEWKDISSLLNNINFDDLLSVKPGEMPLQERFKEITRGLKFSIDLSSQWNRLLNDINSTMGKGFDKTDDRVAAIRLQFDAFMKDVNEKSKGFEIKEPALKLDKSRREDEKSRKTFASGIAGLEEFWHKGQSEEAKNTAAVEENTKTLKEQREEKKKAHDQEVADLQRKQKQREREYKMNTGRIRDEEKENEQEKKQREKQEQNQRRVYGISKSDLDRLEELKKKEKQFRARGDNLSHDENKELKALDERRRNREMHLRNFNNPELRENERRLMREKARNARRLQGIEERRESNINTRLEAVNNKKKEFNFSSENTTTKDNIKEGVRVANKDVVTELRDINTSTATMAKFFDKVGIV